MNGHLSGLSALLNSPTVSAIIGAFIGGLFLFFSHIYIEQNRYKSAARLVFLNFYDNALKLDELFTTPPENSPPFGSTRSFIYDLNLNIYHEYEEVIVKKLNLKDFAKVRRCVDYIHHVFNVLAMPQTMHGQILDAERSEESVILTQKYLLEALAVLYSLINHNDKKYFITIQVLKSFTNNLTYATNEESVRYLVAKPISTYSEISCDSWDRLIRNE